MSRIMIVDDDVIIAEELKEILISDGYQVIKVIYSADEAITLAGILRPDLILMDIHFQEGLDGITAVRKMRSGKENWPRRHWHKARDICGRSWKTPRILLSIGWPMMKRHPFYCGLFL